MKLIAHTDGGCRHGNISGIGVVLNYPEVGGIIRIARYLGIRTNNEAEYEGLIEALNWAVDDEADDVKVLMDSEVVVKQMTAVYTVKAPNLKVLYDRARSLVGYLPKFTIQHIRREFNKEADYLANLAMDVLQHACR